MAQPVPHSVFPTTLQPVKEAGFAFCFIPSSQMKLVPLAEPRVPEFQALGPDRSIGYWRNRRGVEVFFQVSNGAIRAITRGGCKGTPYDSILDLIQSRWIPCSQRAEEEAAKLGKYYDPFSDSLMPVV